MTDSDGMQVFGLLGNPVGHSLSPPMHEAAYAAHDMDARYVLFEPHPNDLETAIEGARALGIAGLNVTIPFKRDVRPFCVPDALAARIGAVNTLEFTTNERDDRAESGRTDAGRPAGYNTDALGATRALAESGVALEGRALVVGAGGAGRAVSFGLAEEGMAVDVVNRTVATAHELAADLSALTDASGYPLDALGEREDLLADADVLVNATSVGMETDESPVPSSALHADLAVLDAVYRPLETTLLRDARAVGARTVDGATMLLYQAGAAFEHWTGKPAPLGAMDEALRARL